MNQDHILWPLLAEVVLIIVLFIRLGVIYDWEKINAWETAKQVFA
jgi:hypothetical protein